MKCLDGNIITEVISFDNYNQINDTCLYHTNYHSNILVYKQGQFAEIIPDKKKLSISKMDAKIILTDFCLYVKDIFGWGEDIKNFLNEYED